MKVLTVTSVTKDSPGAGQFTVVGTYADETLTQPAQRVTIGEFPSGNRSWSRAHRLTDAVIQCIRSATAVGMNLSSFSKICMAFENALTYIPKINTQPASASCVASSTAATFNVTDTSSELSATYQWQYETKASGTIVTTGTELADGDTVTVNGTIYRFKDTMAQINDVKRNGTTAATTLENLIKAINGTGTPGTEYFTGTTAHTTVRADSALTVSSTTLTLRARTSGTGGNAYTLTKSSTQLSVSGAVLSGGGSWSNASGTVLNCAYTNGTTATLTCTPTTTEQTGAAHRCQITNAIGTSTTDGLSILTIT